MHHCVHLRTCVVLPPTVIVCMMFISQGPIKTQECFSVACWGSEIEATHTASLTKADSNTNLWIYAYLEGSRTINSLENQELRQQGPDSEPKGWDLSSISGLDRDTAPRWRQSCYGQLPVKNKDTHRHFSLEVYQTGLSITQMRKHSPRELFVPELKIHKPYLTHSSAQLSL